MLTNISEHLFFSDFCDILIAMSRYYDDNRHNLSNNNKQLIRIFLITLACILVVGIPALLIIKRIKTGGGDDHGFLVGAWEKIPEAGYAKNITGGSGEEGGEPVIDEEDKDYTHMIKTSDDDTVTIGFAGDILFDENYAVGDKFKRNGDTAEGIVGNSLLDKMRGVDIMMINNEFPYSGRGEPRSGKTYTFRARPETTSILKSMGADIVSLANNHAYDYGETALVDSFAALDEAGIVYAGAGNNIDEASHPVYYVTDNGMKIAFICATQIERLDNPDTKGATEDAPGVFRCFNDSQLLEKIAEARSKNAYVIVFVHWGTESTTEVDYLQRDQAKEIAQAGADLIIGAHPHVLQRIDYVDGVPVVYSLGNYIFNSKTLDTGMVITTLHKNGAVNLQFVPAIQSGCAVNEAEGEERSRVLNWMASISPGVNIDENGYISP